MNIWQVTVATNYTLEMLIYYFHLYRTIIRGLKSSESGVKINSYYSIYTCRADPSGLRQGLETDGKWKQCKEKGDHTTRLRENTNTFIILKTDLYLIQELVYLAAYNCNITLTCKTDGHGKHCYMTSHTVLSDSNWWFIQHLAWTTFKENLTDYTGTNRMIKQEVNQT